MASKAITRNDLKAVLDEVLPIPPSEYMKLLWTNPSPTTSFAGQTLSIDISEYDFLVVTTNWYANGNTYEIGVHLLKNGERCIVTDAKDVNGYRVFDLTNANQIGIGDGLQYTFNGGNAIENKRLAPVKIYGIHYVWV